MLLWSHSHLSLVTRPCLTLQTQPPAALLRSSRCSWSHSLCLSPAGCPDWFTGSSVSGALLCCHKTYPVKDSLYLESCSWTSVWCLAPCSLLTGCSRAAHLPAYLNLYHLLLTASVTVCWDTPHGSSLSPGAALRHMLLSLVKPPD